MFSNIESKIKVMAMVSCGIGMFLSLYFAIKIWSLPKNYFYDFTGLGFIVLIVGCFLSWVISLFEYGFGQLIEYTKNINEKLNGTVLPAETKTDKFKQWLDEYEKNYK